MAFLGFTGGLMHVLNHDIFKALLFMDAGSISHSAGTLAIDRLLVVTINEAWCGGTLTLRTNRFKEWDTTITRSETHHSITKLAWPWRSRTNP
ncbi:MAG: hypothetical protein ACUVQV_06845 [Dissulfurimicrobium sp.]|uniref:hypothetical protein n=1 Tax=Dissulfurimicrobium sp. TaxID=2022436 RepID=UPI0040491C49